MIRYACFILFLVIANTLHAQKDVQKWMEEGDEFYRKEKFPRAADAYSKALQLNANNEKAKFNLGNSLYRQDKKLDAVQLFAELLASTTDPKVRSKAWYNKGVILTDQKNLEGSIDAYKNSLRNDPGDKEARENLQKALLELKKKQQEKKKPDQEKQKNKQEQKNQSSSKMQPKEAEQRLRLLQQKEKEVRERVQKEKTKSGGSQVKDW